MRPARRSLVELTAAASRAIDDRLRVTSAGLIAAPAYDPPRSAPAAKTEEETTAAPRVTASAPVEEPEALNEATARRARCANPDSTAEMVVNIAKDYHKNAFESIKLAVGAALDHAKDFAEKRLGSDGALKAGRGGVETNLATGLNATAAEFHSEALEMMKANVNTILEYARELAGTTTAADFVQLTGTQARKQCELILKQAGSLRSLTQPKSKSSTD